MEPFKLKMDTSENVSNLTILKPRELQHSPSTRLTTDFLIELDSLIHHSKWKNRKQFYFQILAFCLGLQNILRFPLIAITQGQATFVLLYIAFMLLVGCSLLFFEVALGQYTGKGFTKVFAICPILEGISFSMAFYCVVVAIYYNVLNTHSFIYLFASFHYILEYLNCNGFPKNICFNDTTNQTLSPENVYFRHRVIYYTIDYYGNIPVYQPSYRNIGVLLFLWALIALVIFRGTMRTRWLALIYCPLAYITLTTALTASLFIEGSTTGLLAMFKLRPKTLLKASVWKNALEQAILALGLGMGPMIILGSYSDVENPVELDCAIVCVCILIGSLLSGSVAFASVGILAHERNQTMTTVLTQEGRYPTGKLLTNNMHYAHLSVHVIFSQLFSRLPHIFAQSLSFIFFLTLTLGGWYSIIAYTETFIISCYKIFPTYVYKKYKTFIDLGTCVLCFGFGILFTCSNGYSVLLALDKYLVSVGLVVIVLCELIAVIYIRGIAFFSDDIDFTLGFIPKKYTEVVWVFSPLLLVFVLALFLFLCITEKKTRIEEYTMGIAAFMLLLPILVMAIYKLYKNYKRGNITFAFSRPKVSYKDDEDRNTISISNRSETVEKRNTRFNRKTSAGTNVAGPSRVATKLNLR